MALLTTEQVLDHIRSKKSDNINNKNNTNNRTTTNNQQLNYITTLTTKTTSMNAPLADIHEKDRVQEEPSVRLAFSEQNQSDLELLDSRSGSERLALESLPARWRGVKVDLFHNLNKGKPNLRLVYNIIRTDGTKISIRASMNGRIRDVTRGITEQDLALPVWQKFRQIRERLKESYPDYKASKFYLTGKKGSLSKMVTFLIQDNNVYTSILIYDDQVFTYRLDGTLTARFEERNGIASQYFGIEGSTMTMIDPEELGI